MTRSGLRVVWGVVVVAAWVVAVGPTSAQSLNEALANTYRSNPTLNAARACSAHHQRGRFRSRSPACARPRAGRPTSRPRPHATNRFRTRPASRPARPRRPTPRGHSLTREPDAVQRLADENNVRRAEAQVGAAREVLRTRANRTSARRRHAYMDVVQATAIVDLQRGNVGVLTELLRATQNRFQLAR